MDMPSASVRAVRHLVVAALLVVAAGCSPSTTAPATTTSPAPTSSPSVADGPTPSSTTPAASSEAETAQTDEPTSEPSPDPAAQAVPDLHPSVDDYPAGRVVVDRGDDQAPLPVLVRVAATSEHRSHGLMEVEEVPDGVGMWFAYDEDHDGGFWMKGTRTDLDIAWVDGAGRIVATETMSVCEADPCEVYDPETTYRSALEVRSGWLADNDVEVGDHVLLDADPS